MGVYGSIRTVCAQGIVCSTLRKGLLGVVCSGKGYNRTPAQPPQNCLRDQRCRRKSKNADAIALLMAAMPDQFGAWGLLEVRIDIWWGLCRCRSSCLDGVPGGPVDAA